ncbi:potassium-transporting ATPase subunit F [Bacillus kandeliae]|nr:hypothetical protein CEW92_05500 [Bacillaceae bacterium SAS-127]PAQ14750.1 hypothetical protein CD798_09555 [Bacillaceae bacterium SAOS 7]
MMFAAFVTICLLFFLLYVLIHPEKF